MRKHHFDIPILLPVHSHQNGKHRFQECARKKEGIAGDRNPNDAPHLTLGRDLIDIPQRFQYGAESMGEDGNFGDAYNAHDGQRDGVDEYHPLAGIFLQQEANGIDQLYERQ